MKGSNGYTLIEIMIALVVFAILAIITSQALYNAFNTRAHLNVEANQLNELQLALSLMQHDVTQMIERSIYGNEHQQFAAFIGLPYYVEFTRLGENTDARTAKSTLKRVAYLCKNKALIRRTWETLDTPNRKHYSNASLIQQVEQCKFAYVAHNGQTLEQWRENAVQVNQQKEALPLAIQVNLVITGLGKMSLLFAISEASYG